MSINDEREKKAKEFLKYVGEHYGELKYNLRKNITYDPQLFDDVFSEAILKCHRSITTYGTDIKDYKQYIFLATKNQYIFRQNQHRKHSKRDVRGFFENNEVIDESQHEEDRFKICAEGLDKLRSLLVEQFGDEKTDAYLRYMQRENRMNYAELSLELNISKKEIRRMMQDINNFISQDERIKALKDEIKNNIYGLY